MTAAGLKRFAAPDGRLLAYADGGGDGPPVLCLAGLTRNRRDFDAVAAHLGPRFRVIRLDSRGRGASERAEDPLAEYAVPVEAGDALALLDHLGLAGAAVIGTSRGGIVAMTMAAMRPGSVSRLALNDIGAEVETAGLARIMTNLGLPPQAETFAQAAIALRDANADAFPGLSLADWERHARQIFDDADGRPVLSYDPRLREAAAAAMAQTAEARISLRPLFDALAGTPLLTIRGANSDILSARTLEEMRAARPDMATATIADRGHAPFLDEPEALAALDAFLT